MNLIQFRESCLKRRCPRNTFYNEKTCRTTHKQDQCFNRWNRKQEESKDHVEEKSERWAEVRKQVWIEDVGFYDGIFKRKDWRDICCLYRKLDREERIYVETNLKHDLWLAEHLDASHICPRSRCPELRYEKSNIVIINRLFHSRLDKLINPLYGINISDEERLNWMKLAKEK